MPEAAGKTEQRGMRCSWVSLWPQTDFQGYRDAKQILGILGPSGCMQCPKGLL